MLVDVTPDDLNNQQKSINIYLKKKKIHPKNLQTLRNKVLRAQITLEIALRLDALIMAALVEQEVALQRERLAAFLARIRSFAGVTSTETDQTTIA